MDAVRIALQVIVVITGLILTLLILMHKGKGGGISDMFGGGMTASLGSSSVAERNLDRITIAVALVSVVALAFVAATAIRRITRSVQPRRVALG